MTYAPQRAKGFKSSKSTQKTQVNVLNKSKIFAQETRKGVDSLSSSLKHLTKGNKNGFGCLI